jgi:hypothetical protein
MGTPNPLVPLPVSDPKDVAPTLKGHSIAH